MVGSSSIFINAHINCLKILYLVPGSPCTNYLMKCSSIEFDMLFKTINDQVIKCMKKIKDFGDTFLEFRSKSFVILFLIVSEQRYNHRRSYNIQIECNRIRWEIIVNVLETFIGHCSWIRTKIYVNGQRNKNAFEIMRISIETNSVKWTNSTRSTIKCKFL